MLLLIIASTPIIGSQPRPFTCECNFSSSFDVLTEKVETNISNKLLYSTVVLFHFVSTPRNAHKYSRDLHGFALVVYTVLYV